MGVGPLTQKAVFLDRDGVINRAKVREGKPYPPATLAELEILPGVHEALRRLRAAGYRLIVVTNQPDVARGTQTREAVEALHAQLLSVGLPIDAFYACYHDNSAGCDCRKPSPGMLVAASLEHRLDLKHCYLVGDRWRDIEAAQRAGVRAIFIDYGYDERRPQPPYMAVRSLAEAADFILGAFAPQPIPQESLLHGRHQQPQG
jgi:D-glycero-D-manno-heptose 1,7-bisphosphate phosphatase